MKNKMSYLKWDKEYVIVFPDECEEQVDHR